MFAGDKIIEQWSCRGYLFIYFNRMCNIGRKVHMSIGQLCKGMVGVFIYYLEGCAIFRETCNKFIIFRRGLCDAGKVCNMLCIYECCLLPM